MESRSITKMPYVEKNSLVVKKYFMSRSALVQVGALENQILHIKETLAIQSPCNNQQQQQQQQQQPLIWSKEYRDRHYRRLLSNLRKRHIRTHSNFSRIHQEYILLNIVVTSRIVFTK